MSSVVKDTKKMLEAVGSTKFDVPMKVSLLDPEGTGEFLLSIGKYQYKGRHPNSKHGAGLIRKGMKKKGLDLLKTGGLIRVDDKPLSPEQKLLNKKHLSNIKALIKELDKKTKH